MATDRTLLKSAQKGHVGSAGLSDPEGAVNAAHRRVYQFNVSDWGIASAGVAESANLVPHASRVIAAYVTTPVTVATNGTDYVTVTVKKRTAGGSATSIATLDTSATGWTAFTPATLTLTAANAELSAADSLTVIVAKAGSGKAICGDSTATPKVLSVAVVTVVVEEI